MNKTSPLTRTLSSLKVLSCALLAATALNTAMAATGTWNTTNGTWNTTNTNWTDVTGLPWNSANGSANTANFNASNGTATVSGGVFANQITYTAPSGNFTIASSNITFSGTNPAISVDPSLTLTISSTLIGTSSISKNGTGTLILSGNNTFSGGFSLNEGRVQIANAANGTAGGSLGTGAITLNGGTLSSSSTTARTINNAATIGGDVVLGNATNTGALTFAGNVDLGGSTRIVTLDSAATFGGVVSNGGLTKNGTGTLTLTGNNTYTGNTTINAGTLGLGGSGTNTIGGNITIAGGQLIYSNTSNSQIADASNVTLTSGNFNVSTRTETINSLDMRGGVLTATGVVNLTLSSNSSFTGGTVNMGLSTGGIMSINGTTRLGNATFAFNHTGSVTGATGGLGLGGNITVDENTTANFTNNSTGSGRVNLGTSNRTMTVGNNATLNMGWAVGGAGNAYSLTKDGNGTLVLSGINTYTGTTFINEGNLTVSGGQAIIGTVTLGNATGAVLYVAQSEEVSNLSGGGSNGGNITIADNQTLTANFTSNTSYTFAGVISGNNGSFTKSQATNNSSATLTLTGNNTYTGATTINGGVLALSGAGALSDSTAVNVTAGTFSISGITATGETIGSLAGSNGTTVVLGNKTLTTANNDSTTFAGVISGTGGSLTKNGNGTLTLNGTNTYTGATRINGGILALGSAGSIANSSNLTIAAGAEFDVTSKTAFTLSAPLTIDVGAAGAGRVDATGISLIYGGPLTLNISTLSPFSYDLFAFQDQSGNFSNINLIGELVASMTYDASSLIWSASSNGYDVTFDKGSGVLTATAVPEPSTWVLIGIGAAFFLYRMGRKKLFAREQN